MFYPNKINILLPKIFIIIIFLSLPFYSFSQPKKKYTLTDPKYLEEVEQVELESYDIRRIDMEVDDMYYRDDPYERDWEIIKIEKLGQNKEIVIFDRFKDPDVFRELREKFKKEEQCYALIKGYRDIIIYYQKESTFEDHHGHLLKYLATKHLDNKEREVFIKRINCVTKPFLNYGYRNVYKGTETEKTTEQRVLHRVEITTTTQVYEKEIDINNPIIQGSWVILIVSYSPMASSKLETTWTISPANASKAYERAREINKSLLGQVGLGRKMKVKKLMKQFGPDVINYTIGPIY